MSGKPEAIAHRVYIEVDDGQAATLHLNLNDLLTKGDGATPVEFWQFVGELGRRLRVPQRLGEAATEAALAAPVDARLARRTNEGEEFARQRTHNLIALGRMLHDADCVGGLFDVTGRGHKMLRADILAADIIGMTRGKSGLGEGRPVFLFTHHTADETPLKDWYGPARVLVIQNVMFRAGHAAGANPAIKQAGSAARAWAKYAPHVQRETRQQWLRAHDRRGAEKTAARAAGIACAAGAEKPQWYLTDEALDRLLAQIHEPSAKAQADAEGLANSQRKGQKW